VCQTRIRSERPPSRLQANVLPDHRRRARALMRRLPRGWLADRTETPQAHARFTSREVPAAGSPPRLAGRWVHALRAMLRDKRQALSALPLAPGLGLLAIVPRAGERGSGQRASQCGSAQQPERAAPANHVAGLPDEQVADAVVHTCLHACDASGLSAGAHVRRSEPYPLFSSRRPPRSSSRASLRTMVQTSRVCMLTRSLPRPRLRRASPRRRHAERAVASLLAGANGFQGSIRFVVDWLLAEPRSVVPERKYRSLLKPLNPPGGHPGRHAPTTRV
jgi:hypothetical protein